MPDHAKTIIPEKPHTKNERNILGTHDSKKEVVSGEIVVFVKIYKLWQRLC